MIPFGPQLIGQTEKALNALLATVLAEDDLSEPQWVTLRLTEQFDGTGPLEEFVHARTHRSDAPEMLAELRHRGLIGGEALTERGRTLVARIGDAIAVAAGPVWADLDAAEVAQAQSILNRVLERSLSILGRRRGSGAPVP